MRFFADIGDHFESGSDERETPVRLDRSFEGAKVHKIGQNQAFQGNLGLTFVSFKR
jgi:hypothetical protein